MRCRLESGVVVDVPEEKAQRMGLVPIDTPPAPARRARAKKVQAGDGDNADAN